MGRAATLSVMGLYKWDPTVFDLFEIPSEMDRETLILNLMAETAELEVLYPNPVVFKNLVGIWSRKELDVWNRLYSTTQYTYNPIENYDRIETGRTSGGATNAHTGTDTTTTTETNGGSDQTSDSLTREVTDNVEGSATLGGSDVVTKDYGEGGTEGETGSHGIDFGGTDTVSGTKNNGHFIAAFDSVASGQSDGLVKQTRDDETASTTTTYGKTEDGESSRTTTFGKTIDDETTTEYGKTEETTEDRSIEETETRTGELQYGKTINGSSSTVHGETITNTQNGEHELRAHGNIGVTTTQEMIQQQRRVENFNMYDIIIESFKMRFCILIY